MLNWQSKLVQRGNPLCSWPAGECTFGNFVQWQSRPCFTCHWTLTQEERKIWYYPSWLHSLQAAFNFNYTVCCLYFFFKWKLENLGNYFEFSTIYINSSKKTGDISLKSALNSLYKGDSRYGKQLITDIIYCRLPFDRDFERVNQSHLTNIARKSSSFKDG